ncbi:LuxR family transcriptional regulator [Plantactinospora soyae]|uniref:DNA-binding CsgD family transcriptional regulator n=1 Tax=Plantactinospora soyae TaxID=1544732 RepID=A0A927RBP6_9ACTN|nr:LuxR family transcriptional regulator [Plantactinospora soyae]MBE1491911.1 DNA-binding CsgD family transcriptional regulator [Plantactinospora soyae]
MTLTTDHQRAAPFVGREAELAGIRAAVAALDAGRQVIVEVIGAAGTGKSRLIAEALRRIDRTGTEIFAGAAAEVERQIPFHVFLHALGDEAAEHLGPGNQLWAEVALQGSGGLLSVARFQLYRGWRRAVADRVGTGMVLVLDDLHWADPASTELIDHLARYPVRGPLLLLLAGRPGTPLPRPVRSAVGDAVFRRICLATRPGAVPDVPDPLALLTSREREVAELTATGATSRLIARQLQVSPRTVDAHLMRIYRKLGVTSRAAMVSLLARGPDRPR